MKIVVIGGTGLIGSQTVTALEEAGHDVVAASPESGVNSVTREGLAEALAGASVVIDVSNSPSFADDDVLAFFDTSTRNLLAAAKEAGVSNYVALSIVGTRELGGSGYFRAKIRQEELIEAAGVPFTIVHATQFFEFAGQFASAGTVDGEVQVEDASVQPIASAEVAAAVARAALAGPTDRTIEVAGPERMKLRDWIGTALASVGDPRPVVVVPGLGYWGAKLEEYTLAPGDASGPGNAQLGETTLAEWLAANTLRV